MEQKENQVLLKKKVPNVELKNEEIKNAELQNTESSISASFGSTCSYFVVLVLEERHS